MILTQTFYSKVSGLVGQRESQALEETMALAHSVLKQAHRRGVELEGTLEVNKENKQHHCYQFIVLYNFLYTISLTVMEQTCGGLPGSV